jgi:hypothetical protein
MLRLAGGGGRAAGGFAAAAAAGGRGGRGRLAAAVTAAGPFSSSSSSAAAAADAIRRLAATTKAPSLRCFTSTSLLAQQKKKEGGTAAAAPTPLGVPYEKLTVGIPKESYPRERRVAATPESVARLVKPGFAVQVEDGAGLPSYFSNDDYQRAGATVVDSVWKTSDIVLKVRLSPKACKGTNPLERASPHHRSFFLRPLSRFALVPCCSRRSGPRPPTRPRRSGTGRSSASCGPARTRPS